MEPMVPLLIIILFWAAVFVFAFWTFTHWLKVPTEAELEAAREAAEASEETATVAHRH